VAAYAIASAPEAPIQAITPASATHTIDCSPAPWPPRTAPDVFQLALVAQRDARKGDGAGQWLLGSLYLFGLGVPKDRNAAINWIEAATRTILPAVRAAMRPDASLSEMEFFAMMLNIAEDVLPRLVQQRGAPWGIAQFKMETRLIIQALSGCQL
jgi:hypothetical protein